MDSNFRPYDYEASFKRLKDILNQADVNYEKTDSLPDREKLTYSNGFYAYCSALFIDIRGSSKLPSKYRRPTLARLYRAYVSEVVAILNSDPYCREVNIVGDGAWAVYNTPRRPDIDDVFAISYALNSMIKVLNYQLVKKDLDPIEVGIGMSYGRALMIKAGYSGSGISDVVYMGDVVNQAAKLAAHGNQGYFDKAIMVSEVFHQNLSDENKELLTWNANRNCWHGDVIRKDMEAWYQENCK
ncbi:adenylate/guanylate cyclase domain-containing protein [Streptomyces sp. S063]|uniref:adenylate/guanylate cyclase domain-containing protein n=1 Tax=Streptomyces sp. S063 TaxID=2005885 RepID=UPI0010086571|nr:adenylate/guanylate cyclase domain-containing protein [Streptomyces sp. S063]